PPFPRFLDMSRTALDLGHPGMRDGEFRRDLEHLAEALARRLALARLEQHEAPAAADDGRQRSRLPRALEARSRLAQPPEIGERKPEPRVRHGIIRLEPQRAAQRFLRRRDIPAQALDEPARGVRLREPRIERERAL